MTHLQNRPGQPCTLVNAENSTTLCTQSIPSVTFGLFEVLHCVSSRGRRYCCLRPQLAGTVRYCSATLPSGRLDICQDLTLIRSLSFTDSSTHGWRVRGLCQHVRVKPCTDPLPEGCAARQLLSSGREYFRSIFSTALYVCEEGYVEHFFSCSYSLQSATSCCRESNKSTQSSSTDQAKPVLAAVISFFVVLIMGNPIFEPSSEQDEQSSSYYCRHDRPSRRRLDLARNPFRTPPNISPSDRRRAQVTRTSYRGDTFTVRGKVYYGLCLFALHFPRDSVCHGKKLLLQTSANDISKC